MGTLLPHPIDVVPREPQRKPSVFDELLLSCFRAVNISLDLATYVRTVCAFLDIPIYGSLTEALHVLFTLYSDFKANVHFQQQLSQDQEQQQPGGGYEPGGGGFGGQMMMGAGSDGANVMSIS